MKALTKNRSLITLTLNLYRKLQPEQEKLLAETMKKNRVLYRLHLFNEESTYVHNHLVDTVSASVVGFRLMLNRTRIVSLPCIEAFLMATIPSSSDHPNTSPIFTAFTSSDIYDKNLLYMIFEAGFG